MEPSQAPNYPDRFAPFVGTALEQSLKLDALLRQVEDGLTNLEANGAFKGVNRLVLTGSGDSLFAALSVVPALRRWTGLAVDALTSIEFARYESPLIGPSDLVISISNSGSSTRTRETALLANAAGARSLALVGSTEGPLAKLASYTLARPVGPLPDLPANWGRCFLNLSEYLAALHALYALGLHLGKERLGAAEIEQRRADLASTTQALPAAASSVEEPIIRLAESLVDMETLWVVGCGPNQGTARYAAAKCHEQVPLTGVFQDLEEWAHLEYFLTLKRKERSVVMVLAPPGNAYDRARELVAGIAGAGGRAIVVTAVDDGQFDGAEAVLALGPGHDELLTPLLYHLPIQLLVLHIARLRGCPQIPLRRKDEYRLIRGGNLRDDLEGLR